MTAAGDEDGIRLEITDRDPMLVAYLVQSNPPVSLLKDDEPLDPDGNPIGPDHFGTGDVAERFARVIAKIEPPYTISLSGSWGVGKTWLTKRLKPLLKGQVSVVEVDR
jgi:hypothetical protein